MADEHGNIELVICLRESGMTLSLYQRKRHILKLIRTLVFAFLLLQLYSVTIKSVNNSSDCFKVIPVK